MKNLFIFGFCLIIFTSSCSNQEINDDVNKSKTVARQNKGENKLLDSLKLKFGKSLSENLIRSPQLRRLLKTKSIEMFDNNSEVLYYAIKDLQIENGIKLENSIRKYYTDVEDYNRLLSILPTLTILIPELPENSFSAEIWDTNEVPAVAVTIVGSNDVPVIFNDRSIETLEGKYTPDFPVIVVKNNERIITNRDINYEFTNNREFLNVDGIGFKFISDAFDSTKNVEGRFAYDVQLDPKLIEAFNIYNYQNPQLSGWHRDLIYYNITPMAQNGPFSYDFMDCIKSFGMVGNPTAAYQSITDQTGDPNIIYVTTNLNSSHWTAGNYSFKIKSLINGKNGVGAETVGFINATASDLFNLQYRRLGNWGINRKIFVLESIQLKKMNVFVPVLNWDLNQYSTSIKITVEEVDIPTFTTITNQENVKFAANFGISPSSGLLNKLGLKLGASLETNQTNTITQSFTQGNDDLGNVIVNFADNVIVSRMILGYGVGGFNMLREYENGAFTLGLEPHRVQ